MAVTSQILYPAMWGQCNKTKQKQKQTKQNQLYSQIIGWYSQKTGNWGNGGSSKINIEAFKKKFILKHVLNIISGDV